MTFISYAQNTEDVLLWRALGHIKNGFYIDVGANDPVEHSVTKAFYDAGWSGINIEPLPVHIKDFDEQRPRDLNLAIAAGSQDGELTMYDVPAVRGWASPEQAVAEAHRAEGYEVSTLKVPVRTLASVCAEHVHGEIHFLKIDVEGFEGEVLRGMDFGRWRPWILVIEATEPGSRVTNHETWEHLVTGQRYRYAWFDGLNRYYVAEEHANLLEHFGVQPNVFDAFISHHLDKAWANGKLLDQALRDTDQALRDTDRRLAEQAQRAEEARVRAEEAHARAEEARVRSEEDAARAEEAAAHAAVLDAELAAVRASLADTQASYQQLSDWAGGLERRLSTTEAWGQDLEQRLLATHASTSWKVTRPLRAAGSFVRALRSPHLARRLVTRLTANERLRRLLIPVMLRHPALNRRVSTSLAAIKLDPPQQAPSGVEVPEHLRGLPASVRIVLADLQRTRNKQGTEH
jgi:FkbM family methyltransferase